eukprot:192605-Pyramimonas_sp.AAC.1
MPEEDPELPATVFGREGVYHCQLLCKDGTARNSIIPDRCAVHAHIIARHGNCMVAHIITISSQCPVCHAIFSTQ